MVGDLGCGAQDQGFEPCPRIFIVITLLLY
jgi:hypothetical protein